MTGEDAEADAADAGPVLKWTDKPILVFVCDETGTCDDLDKIDDIVLADEKVALGMRAFRTLRMHPESADADPFLEGHGKSVPRMLFVDPVESKVTVLEVNKIKPGTLFKAMAKASRGFWKENLDKVVESHLKILTEQDQLANADKTLAEKEGRAADDEKKLAKVKAERQEVRQELEALRKAQAELWKLTPKHKAS